MHQPPSVRIRKSSTLCIVLLPGAFGPLAPLAVNSIRGIRRYQSMGTSKSMARRRNHSSSDAVGAAVEEAAAARLDTACPDPHRQSITRHPSQPRQQLLLQAAGFGNRAHQGH
jgi:hypothetical protein